MCFVIERDASAYGSCPQWPCCNHGNNHIPQILTPQDHATLHVGWQKKKVLFLWLLGYAQKEALISEQLGAKPSCVGVCLKLDSTLNQSIIKKRDQLLPVKGQTQSPKLYQPAPSPPSTHSLFPSPAFVRFMFVSVQLTDWSADHMILTHTHTHT